MVVMQDSDFIKSFYLAAFFILIGEISHLV